MSVVEPRLVLTEEEALQLLSFLITAARLLLDEPADYGPLRLLLAAQYLCADTAPRSSDLVRGFMHELEKEIPDRTAERYRNPAAFAAFLDDGCVRVAHALLAYYGRE